MKNIKYLKSAYSVDHLPKDNLPEIILCGRSNVGKSSFINCIFNRKNIAKTSSTPGKTRSLNYYIIDDRLYFVDLPGFGYAKVNKKERETWKKLIDDFLTSSENIKLALHFIDSRHKPTDLDALLNQYLRESGIPYLFILTKTDKLNQSQKSASFKLLNNQFPEAILNENTFHFSSVKGFGKKQILSYLNRIF